MREEANTQVLFSRLDSLLEVLFRLKHGVTMGKDEKWEP